MEIIRVGDEIKAKCYGTGYVTRVCNNTCAVTWQDGTNGVLHANAVTCTGKHDEHIAKLFKEGQEQPFTTRDAIKILQSRCPNDDKLKVAIDYAIKFMEGVENFIGGEQ